MMVSAETLREKGSTSASTGTAPRATAQLAEAMAAHIRRGGAVIYTTHQPVDIDVPRRALLNLDDYSC